MNRYVSTVGLYARSSLYKILLITLVTALLAGFLVYRYPTPQEITENTIMISMAIRCRIRTTRPIWMM